MMIATRIFNRIISANLKQTNRTFYGSSIIRSHSYEGDGKTTISILNRDFNYGLMIDAYSKSGFRLNNGFRIIGPIAIFPKSVLSWQVGDKNDINEKSLSLFTIIEPRLDVLVLGIGDEARTPEFDRKMFNYAKQFNLNLEVVPTNQACAIFNFLNAEERFIAAGLIPS